MRGTLLPACIAFVACAISLNAPAQPWVQHGPGPSMSGQVEGITDFEVVGAVNAIAAHPTDAATLYIAAVNGGIWKSTNATAAKPTWVEQLGIGRALAFGSIEFDPTDATHQTLVAGNGNFSSFGGAGGDRAGLWRTTDGGTTWTSLTGGGTLVGLNISGIAARGPVIVISVNAAVATANRGIWRSTDNGASFTRISGAIGSGLPAGAAFDLASDLSDNTRLFTSAGVAGVFRSVDTGATWTKVSNAAIDALLTAGGRVEISVGTGNSVFVAIVNASRLAGLFRSGDNGGTWTVLDLPGTVEAGTTHGVHPGSQGNTHLSLVAHPTNTNVVYVGGDRQPHGNEPGSPVSFPNSIGAQNFTGRLFRVDASQATGSQASPLTHSGTSSNSAPHADSRDMAHDANGDLIEGDDGGVYRRTSPGGNTGDWFSLNGDLVITELHSVAWDSVAKIAIGGAQDNAVPQQRLPGNRRWPNVGSGDGGDVVVDDSGTPGLSVRYTSAQNLRSPRRRTFNASNTQTASVTPALTVLAGGNNLVGQFVTPLRLNNVDPQRLVIGGGNSLYESDDQGDTITEIGPGIIANGGGHDAIAYGGTGNPDILYVGAAMQVRVRTAAAPAALTPSATYPGAGLRPVVGIALNPAVPQTAFVVDATNVYRTTDSGATWTNITGNLLALTPGNLRSIAFSSSNADGTVLVGSDTGVFAGRGPAFTTWAVLGTGLPRVPVYELEYDATDEVLVAGTLGRGAWTVNLEERNPVDVALVLDLSGSMLSPACPTCSPKVDVLKDAVELFVQLWTAFAAPGDRIAVNYFRSDVRESGTAPDLLVPIIPNAATIAAEVQAQSTVPANLTAMGGGVQTAVNRLTDAARPRHILLFTDGMQNVNPLVDSTTFVIDDKPGFAASGVSPSSPRTDLNSALGIRVNTIGVGSTPAFVDLLDDIASETGGLFKLTTAPDDELRRFYVEELVDVLRDLSPQLVAYRRGALTDEGASEPFTVNSSVRRLVLKVSTTRGNKIVMRAEKDGVDVTSLGRRISGPFYEILSIDLPANVQGQSAAAGDWIVRIAGRRGTPYQAAAIVDETVLKYEFEVGRRPLAGRPLELRARLRAGAVAIPDARVRATVFAPRQSLASLLAVTRTPAPGPSFEPSATPAQRKLQVLAATDREFARAIRPIEHRVELKADRDGTYAASFLYTQVPGTYTIVFEVQGRHPAIGSYTRSETRTTSVRFAGVAREASKLSASCVGARGPRNCVLTLRPADARGSLLGPDYGGRIALRINGRPTRLAIEDRGDGTYALPLKLPDATDPKLTLLILGEPVYDGPLSKLPQSSERDAIGERERHGKESKS